MSTALPKVNTINANTTSEQGEITAPTEQGGITVSSEQVVSEAQECYEDLSM